MANGREQKSKTQQASSDQQKQTKARLQDESESFPDGEVDAQEEPDPPPAKRQRKDNGYKSEAQLEADVAFNCQFNAFTLSEEEEEVLPANIDQTAYAKVRNHILTKWRADVSRYLTEEDACTKVLPRFKDFAHVAYKFLNASGYINFGVSPEIVGRGSTVPEKQETVIVIGAGLAGLAAARQLRANGYKVVVLEGRTRLGGRVYTKRMEAQGQVAVADLGGSIITGVDGNPLAVLAKQLNIPMHDISPDVPLYMDDGTITEKDLDDKVYKQFDEALEECSKLRDALGPVTDNISLGTALEVFFQDGAKFDGPHRQLYDWHMANVEFANAAKLSSLSLRHWDQDDPFEFHGAHIFLPGGNLRLITGLAQDVPVFFNHKVQSIEHCHEKVLIRTETAEFCADAALVTVPLGVLKKGDIEFNPPLSGRKLGAIQRLGMGVLNKVVLLFPRVFWDETKDMFGRVVEGTENRGEFYLFYSYAGISGGAVLAALIAGQAAEMFENMPPGEAVQKVMGVIKRIHEKQGIAVPPPIQAICTRWGKDPMSYGSYSSMAVGSGPDDYDIMAETVGTNVFFAGEATTRKWPATMHGAYLTGLREAAKIDAYFEKLRMGEIQAPSLQESELPHLLEPTADMLQTAMRMCTMSQLLTLIFDKLEPDLEFGCFSAVFAPSSSSYINKCLIQVDLGWLQKGSKSPIFIYTILTRQQLDMLQELSGGDEARLLKLTTEFGAKLVGRTGLTSNEEQFVELVAKEHDLSLSDLAKPEEPTSNGTAEPQPTANHIDADNGLLVNGSIERLHQPQSYIIDTLSGGALHAVPNGTALLGIRHM